MLYYNGDKNDFVSLCNQASKTGLKKTICDYEEDVGEAAYEGTKKALLMEFYLDGEEIDAVATKRDGVLVQHLSSDNEEPYEIDAQISVIAVQNGTMSLFDLMGGDYEDYEATQSVSLLKRNIKNTRTQALKLR